MKIIIDNKIPFLSALCDYGEVLSLEASAITPEVVKNAEVLLIRTRTLCNEKLLNGSKVKFIGSATIGTDHIDMDYCRKQGLKVANATGCNAPAVMQYVVRVLLELSKQHNKPLSSITLGIIGVGHVGSLVAKAAQAMGMHVLLNDPPRALREGNKGFCTLEEILRQSDAISIHVPLQEDTRHLVNNNFLSQCRQGLWLINSSRGEVMDETALLQHRPKLNALVLDVWEHEPQINEQLLSLTDIATPHIAGYALQGKHCASKMIVEALAKYYGFPPPTLPALPADTKPAPILIEKIEDIGQTLYFVINKTFPIFEEDKKLREHPAHFDLLRNNYLLRNDFSAHTIQFATPHKQLQAIMQELGFFIINNAYQELTK